MKLDIVVGDLFDISCDALVNPTDAHFSGGGGLDLIFHKKCGKALKVALQKEKEKAGAHEEAEAQGNEKAKIQVGDVLVTEGFGLPVKYILHAVVPTQKYEKGSTYSALQKCCRNIVRNAIRKGVKHLAMPLLGTGNKGYSLGKPFYPGCGDCSLTAAAILSGIIQGEAFNKINAKSGIHVTLVCTDGHDQNRMLKAQKWILGEGLDARSRVRGSLLGGAIGDALGYPIEFEFEKSMELPCKAEYILDRKTGKAVISDDTQMTLYTACGLLWGYTRSRMKGIGADFWHYIGKCYLDWLKTQEPSFEGNMDISWVSLLPEMNVRRDPGKTCLSALQNEFGSVKTPMNDSKGSGGVMRIAPIPLYLAANHFADQEYNLKTCAETAAITHGHPLGWLSAAALGNLLYDIMLNFSLDYAVQETIETLQNEYGRYPETQQMIALMKKAVSLAHAPHGEDPNLVASFDIMNELGEGWCGEQAFAVALFCVMACGSHGKGQENGHGQENGPGYGLEQCLLNAVCHRGDSDTIGSIAGQIWGAYYGEASLQKCPQLLQNLEMKDVILEIADDLVSNCKISEYSSYGDPAWAAKYLGGHYFDGTPYVPGSGNHDFYVVSSQKKDSFPIVVQTVDYHDNPKTETMPFELKTVPGKWNQWDFCHLASDPKMAKAGAPGFGIVKEPKKDPKTEKYSYTHGYFNIEADGAIHGSYTSTPFTLLPNRTSDVIEIFIETSPNPWVGRIRRRTKDWNEPYEFEVKKNTISETFCKALALALMRGEER